MPAQDLLLLVEAGEGTCPIVLARAQWMFESSWPTEADVTELARAFGAPPQQGVIVFVAVTFYGTNADSGPRKACNGSFESEVFRLEGFGRHIDFGI